MSRFSFTPVGGRFYSSPIIHVLTTLTVTVVLLVSDTATNHFEYKNFFVAKLFARS